MTARHQQKSGLFKSFVMAGMAGMASLGVIALSTSSGLANSRVDCFSADRGRRIEGCSQLLNGKLNPFSASLVYAMRALAYSIRGRHTEALADYDKSLAINPNLPHALNNRAWTYYKLGRPSKGFADVQKALKLSPRSAHTYDTRAHIHQALGHLEKALADYHSAIRFGGSKIIKLYQCGLQASGLYSGSVSGISSGAFQAALETCISDKNCDPLPADEECRKLTS